MNSHDFYDWYGTHIGWDEMARQFGFASHDEMCDWQALQLGYKSFDDLEKNSPDDYIDDVG